MIDISELKSVNDSITGENLNILADSLYYLTSKRNLNLFDKSKVFEILIVLQEFT